MLIFLFTSTDELFKSAAYLTEAFTGVQPQTLASAPTLSRNADADLPGTITSLAMNDPVPCTSTTRSSSILTHIVYPEDDGVQPPSRFLLSTEPPEEDSMRTFPKGVSSSSQPPATAPSAPPPDRSMIEASMQMEKERPRPEDAKSEKVPAFNLAFRTHAPYFDWLDDGGKDPLGGTGQGACVRTPMRTESMRCGGVQPAVPNGVPNCVPSKSFRFDRFSKAMVGTTLWEAPKAILSGRSLSIVIDSIVQLPTGFDWYSLSKGSTIVDVGGGIGSTTMTLACALNAPRADPARKQDGNGPMSDAVPRDKSKPPSDPSAIVVDESRNTTAAQNDVNLRFVVQDKPVVTIAGVEAWRSKCPDMLESGQVAFQSLYFVL